MNTKRRVFVSFDSRHDEDVRLLLSGHANLSDASFEVSGWSDWQDDAAASATTRGAIDAADVVLVICGHHTRDADGVNAELEYTQSRNKPYHLLAGRQLGLVQKPRSARATDIVEKWTRENINSLIERSR